MKVVDEDHVCGRRVRKTIKVNQTKTIELLRQNKQMLVEIAKMRRKTPSVKAVPAFFSLGRLFSAQARHRVHLDNRSDFVPIC